MVRPLGIRTRLTLWYGVVLVTTLVALGLVVWFSAGALLRASVDEALAVQASDVRAALERGEELTRLDPGRPGIFTAIYARDGRLRIHSSGMPRRLAMPPPGSTTITLPDGQEQAAVLEASAPDGETIVVGTSLADVDRNLERLAMLLVGTGGAGAVASFAGGWLLSGRALGPVERLTREADAIGPTDLERRLPLPSRIDEVGRLARTLNRMLDRVAGSVARERAFIAAASHDLRTPIASLRTELELAARAPSDPATMLRAIQVAHADAVRLSNLASDLLDLAVAEATGRALVRQPVAVNDLVDAAAHRVRPLADEKAIEVRAAAPDAVVEVDRVRLEQALVNLLANAIREAPERSFIDVSARMIGPGGSAAPTGAGDHGLELLVEDRGPGVAADVRPTLFQPFASPARGRSGGHGLGLATAAAAVRAHGGSIGYADRPGGGASFRLEVPADAMRPHRSASPFEQVSEPLTAAATRV